MLDLANEFPPPLTSIPASRLLKETLLAETMKNQEWMGKFFMSFIFFPLKKSELYSSAIERKSTQ
jgi:hypothetical protein